MRIFALLAFVRLGIAFRLRFGTPSVGVPTAGLFCECSCYKPRHIFSLRYKLLLRRLLLCLLARPSSSSQLLHKYSLILSFTIFFTPTTFCRNQLLRKLAFTHITFDTNPHLHQPASTQTRFYPNLPPTLLVFGFNL